MNYGHQQLRLRSKLVQGIEVDTRAPYSVPFPSQHQVTTKGAR